MFEAGVSPDAPGGRDIPAAVREEFSARVCAACAAPLVQSSRGRPRKWCAACAPSAAVVGKSVSARRWRELNAEKVAERNAARRLPPEWMR